MNEYGFLITPFRKVRKPDCFVTDEVEYMTADAEDRYIVAQATEPLDENGCLKNRRVTCRHRDEIIDVDRERVTKRPAIRLYITVCQSFQKLSLKLQLITINSINM